MGKRKKRKRFLGGLKLAAKLHHLGTAGTNLTAAAALSIALPCKEASKSQTLYENPGSPSFPKIGMPVQVSAKQ